MLIPVLLTAALSSASTGPLPALKVSDNDRFLVTESGDPFFWLGDTAWEIFHRLTLEQAAHYLDVRKKQGYNVIQAVALAEFDGVDTPNAYGHLPLVNRNPAEPATDGYWEHVDAVVKMANERGLYIGFLPTWGRYWRDEGSIIFTPENAEAYGEWLGKRYKDKALVWILGGDRPIENATHLEIMRAMARGLRKGDGGNHLITFHPPGGAGAFQWVRNEDWLDFGMRQNGHEVDYPRYSQTLADYNGEPTKPILDGEPVYEAHPINFDAGRFGHSCAADVRRALYWDVFHGAFGHTYGHHSVWQMWTPERGPVNNPLNPWQEAILDPGAEQMQHGRALIESRPFLTRIPDDSVIEVDRVATAVPGAGRYRMVATRDSEGGYLMVYTPLGRAFTVLTDKLPGKRLRAWWYDPRSGRATDLGEFDNVGSWRAVTPTPGETLDWVLVIDDALRNFPAPGKPYSSR